MNTTIAARTRSPEVEERLAFARAALALAGHEVTDPELIRLLERSAYGEITVDQALEAGLRHIQG